MLYCWLIGFRENKGILVILSMKNI